MKAQSAIFLQKALHSRLASSEVLKSMTNGVFDFVPEKTEFPYITYGRLAIQEDITKTTGGSEINIDILIWDNSTGRLKSLRIAEEIEALLEIDLDYDGLIYQKISAIENEVEQYGLYGTIVRFSARVM